MLRELQDLGLGEKEAKVYLAALEIGRATADQLAKQAKVLRPTTYVQLENLMKMGLMSTYEEGKKTYFAPESPEALRRVVDGQKERLRTQEGELARLLPDLTRLFESAGERPVVRFFAGKEGIIAMREESLRDLKKGQTLYVMYAYESLFDHYSKEQIIDFSDRRAEKGIHLKIIYSRKEGKLSKDNRGPNTDRGYLPSESFSLGTDIFIFGDKVAIMALKGHIFGIILESSAIADSMTRIFNLLWGIADTKEE